MDHSSSFRGVTDTPVLDLWWLTPALDFKVRVDPFLCFLAYVILRFTSNAAPADCIEVTVAVKPFWSTYLQTCLQALVKVQTRVRTHDSLCAEHH